jgi:pimeloyl-ACP methyl ester carboxylesterase
MPRVRSGDAEIFYEVTGDGLPVVLLHPFPANHELWMRAAQALISRYKLILPDLRGHGDSDIGDGPAATMHKHAADIMRVLDDARVDRAAMAGISIGGYAIFEFWRQQRGRVSALALFNTKAQADNPEARAARLQTAADVMERGIEPFLENMVQKVIGKTIRETRVDLVEGALRMMRKMSPEDIALVQRGMAERTDSMATLKTINVPTLVITGDEDIMTGVAEAELMRQNIAGSQMKVISRAGHFAVWEQAEESGRILRQFLDASYS